MSRRERVAVPRRCALPLPGHGTLRNTRPCIASAGNSMFSGKFFSSLRATLTLQCELVHLARRLLDAAPEFAPRRAMELAGLVLTMGAKP